MTEKLFAQLAGQSASESPVENESVAGEDLGAWSVPACFHDRGHRFALDLLAIPFGGPCAGYGLLLTSPVDATSDAEARAYFEALMAGTSAA